MPAESGELLRSAVDNCEGVVTVAIQRQLNFIFKKNEKIKEFRFNLRVYNVP